MATKKTMSEATATTESASTAKKTTAKSTASTAEPKATAAKKTPSTAAKTTSTAKKATAAKKVEPKSSAPKEAAAKKVVAKETVKEPVATIRPIEQKVIEKKKILFVASEVQPYAGTGGLGEVMGSLGKNIIRANPNYDVRVVLPLYECIPQELRNKIRYLKHINVQLSWRSQYCGIFECVDEGVTYYFIDNEYYYKRPNLYGYYDDGERFAFFSKAVLDILPEVGFRPDVLHCNDWQTALVPIYYKLYYMHREFFGGIKTVFTVHNVEYQGKFGKNIIEDVFGISAHEFHSVEHCGAINLMKGAIDYSDAVTTVSPSYAQELLTEYYGHGLDGTLRHNAHKLRGILNGIDTDSYNPSTDPAMFVNYNVDTVNENKRKNKAELQSMLNLPVNPNVPMVAVISRLVGHKGIDLIKCVLSDILQENLQLVILGKGDADYENYFTYMQSISPGRIASVIGFNKDLSRKIYSAADFFLMPSKSEPCGLGQMMSARYGAVPIVRETGGLRDSIIDAGDGLTGNGYVFRNYNAHEMLYAIQRGVGLYNDYYDTYVGLRERAMTTDFSWKRSALEYIKLFEDIT